jgi:ubiquinone/menaquinone biosynthesis C-methylase UbiE
MEKLYNDSYLKKTTEFINDIKQKSYDLLSLTPTTKLLEIGCGNGYDAIELAKRIGSEGKVVGIDIDPALVERSKKNAEENFCQNIEFIVSDAEKIPYADNFFDVIRAERVFQHLKNPETVLEEALRVLKPGGIILLIETDWYGMNVYTQHYTLEQKIKDTLVSKVLINGYASRNIQSYYIKAGINDMQLLTYPFVLNNYKVANELIKFDTIIDIGKQFNILTKEDAEQWSRDIAFLETNNCFTLTTNMLLYLGTKH